ncbi:hypothetical protein C343_02342 [Cryptococcus neoformans C23]|uniref:Uncharacterized protein n=1 Tax=Cryptococcus neoformans (strain H99 / ATCC 208821 / CBS 10515 / FGSC 9487) TaxID=235443 RepID=J9VLE3_CRYN9|nr:hypothetical protein CNAG_05006 [Cryptococcus neoformans var. grubii H99]AUB23904.1 hypothetical protein CKF44_05006 [Cryptococcus neoformans var. grubii]OWZ33389.1 hypothetical protein C347_02410 [Cryptococcus neoformans var. grubii AD2-60a]OWZ45485.1 hypothetical protein C343_02342 [Cryptococcus neoformans var. grubii C23]OXC85546.1 hypothetical protein C344_02150 [Cryptococcus neoformans var. grubii AD1-7a]AFR94271.1 hypothetical protein CNAG_05006 [Cryptococcus neoformans var. grubii H9|eukprot:XP_012048655.1 hypothetical protein CNAG_05006 [Cryptococcus neoformans var. grubii H99]
MSSSLRTTKPCAQCLTAIRARRPAETTASIAGPSNYQSYITAASPPKRRSRLASTRASASPPSLRGDFYQGQPDHFHRTTQHSIPSKRQKSPHIKSTFTKGFSLTSRDVTSAPLLQSGAARKLVHSVAGSSNYQAYATEYNASFKGNPRSRLASERLYHGELYYLRRPSQHNTVNRFRKYFQTTATSANSTPRPDPVLQHLSHIALPDFEPPPPETKASPIPQHTFSPKERSAALSALQRSTSSPPSHDTTSAQLLQSYTDLYMSSPQSQLFTISEVQEVLKALKSLQVREAGDRQIAEEQIEPLVEEIKALVGDERKASRGLELLVLSSRTKHSRRIKTKNLVDAEKSFRSLFPKPPPEEDVGGRHRYQAALNHLIYLCALAGQGGRLEDWWNRLERDGFKADGHTWLSRMILLDRAGKGEEVNGILDKVLEDFDEEVVMEEDILILVNYAMVVYAKLGRWDVVSEMYGQLRPTDSHDLSVIRSSLPNPSYFDGTHPHAPHHISLPSCSIRLTRRSYSPLLLSLSIQGHLPAALTIFKHIFEDGHTPSVDDYTALFKGFAKYGVTPSIDTRSFGNAGQVSEAGKMLGVANTSGGGESDGLGGSFEQRMSGIWERGAMFAESFHWPVENLREGNGEWTLEALQDIFESFLTLRPILPSFSPLTFSDPQSRPDFKSDMDILQAEKQARLYAKAPGRKAVWTVLKAFGRVTHGDEEVLKQVWERMETKFGPENEEGWKGWRVDKRLDWFRKSLLEEE